MKKILLIAQIIVVCVLLINFFYYRNLYQKQVNYAIELLDRQVRIVGLEVDSINYAFGSDLEQIIFPSDSYRFFDKSRPDVKIRIIEQLKLFYSKYRDFVTKIILYNDTLNEYVLSKDDSKNEWIEGEFILFDQIPVEPQSVLKRNGNEFNYHVVIFREGQPCGNIAVTIDYQKCFGRLFSKYNLKNYQWQWVITENGEIIYDNYEKPLNYSKTDNIISSIKEGLVSNIRHSASDGGRSISLFSSFYSTQLLYRDLGIVFSTPVDFFQKYIVRNSVFIVTVTILLVQLIIFLFLRFLSKQKTRIRGLENSEETLKRLIEEMPAGVIIYNKKREILKANKVAASYFAYMGENDMTGKIFPEFTFNGETDYFSNYFGTSFNPEQFIIIKKPIGEQVIYRSSIPVVYGNEDATLEILIDVTILESARQQEVRANVAKTEFLARMSYEIRTPLNGIIGMTDILNRYDLSPELKDIVYLLRRSTEVLLGIVNDILDFSKIESGKMILEELPFNVREEIYYAIDLTKPGAIENNNLITCEIEEEVPETVIGDPYRLRQVIVNLINHSNSNTHDGQIVIKCKKIFEKEGLITLGFEIVDTGRAFEKAELKKIFGDIVRIESVLPRMNNESIFTTLIARQLIELMGGTLNAESPSGIAGPNGTRIVFSINVYSNIRIQKNIPSPGIKTVSQIKTLVISGPQGRDEEIVSLLHKAGLHFSITSFTKLTIKQLQMNQEQEDGKYNLLFILDDNHFDGFEAARIISENKLNLYYRMILISSNDRKGNYLKCITYGVDYYFVKPFDPIDLRHILTDMFEIENDEIFETIEEGKIRELNILIVEDNKMNRRILVKMLENLGFKCDEAEEGHQAFLKVMDKKYDLVLMDLIMPEMDGYESARRILDMWPETVIVATTADNMPETRKKAELSGIKEFISKPVRAEDLKHLFMKYFGI